MFELFLEKAVIFIQKILLGAAFALSFLGIPLGDTATSTITATTPIQEMAQERASEKMATAEEVEATSLPKMELAQETVPAIKTVVIASPPPAPPPLAPRSTPLIPQAVLNEEARAAVVNIFCLTKTVSVLEPITGSGVMIDSRGVILTNAHVAQYLLLKDYGIPEFLNCVIRGGSPAIPMYKAELLYLPPAWIEANAPGIKLDKPTGTGENDFALLLITETTRPGGALPKSFPSMPVYTGQSEIDVNDPVLLAAYPAGFLGGTDVTKNLWLTSTITSLKKLYTFRNQTLDGFSLGGVVLAQQGASGGGVFSLKTGELIGLIATSLLEGSTDERDLRAISLFHINESLLKSAGQNLQTFLSEDLKQKSAAYNRDVAPRLTQILTDILDKK